MLKPGLDHPQVEGRPCVASVLGMHEKRIGIVTHKVVPHDGQGRVNLAVAEQLLKRGYGVTVVSSEIDERLLDDPRVRWIEVRPSRLPTKLIQYQLFAIKSHFFVDRECRDIDLLIVNGFITWKKSNINIVHFVHSALRKVEKHSNHFYKIHYRFYQFVYTFANSVLERRAFRSSQVLIAVSEKVRQDLIAIGSASDKITVINNGVDVSQFSPGPAERGRFHLPSQPVIGLFVGDIRTTRKNLDTVLYALRDVPDLHLAVAGCWTGSPFPSLARDLGIADRVHFLGFQRNVPALMRSVDFLVFPSRYEPFALVVLEAAACGLPVIASRASGVAELFDDHGALIIDDPNDASTLAGMMERLRTDPGLRRRMASAARQIAERHTWQSMAEAYLDIIERSFR